MGNSHLEHAPLATQFMCLTDQVDEVQALNVPAVLWQGLWPGWWSKIGVLEVPGPVLYLDLDVTITGNLTPLLDEAGRQDLIACEGFWGADDPNKINSSVMGWNGDASDIHVAFSAAPAAHMSIYHQRNKPQKWGDQAFVRDHWGGPIATWQEVLPGKVVSFKRDVLTGRRKAWADARVVVSHGQPRPWARDGADAWLAARKRAA
jgi:hypothetical protein